MPVPADAEPRHILLLVERDWSHPGAAASAQSLQAQVEQWLSAGHRVTMIAAAHPAAERVERRGDRFAIHRMGSGRTVAPRAAWAVLRGVGRDADVALEVIDAHAFLTPTWWFLRVPKVAMVGQIPPRLRPFLRVLYGTLPVLTTSDAAREELVALGIPPEGIQVVHPGVTDAEPGAGGPEHAPGASLAVLDGAAAGARMRLRDSLARSETGKAAGLAGATLANNALQLIFTVVFTRLLGASGYGSLAALVSAYLLLLVGGQSVQAAATREVALGRLGADAHAAATLWTWSRRLVELFVVVSIGSILLRVPIAHLVGVPEHPWGAAAIVPTGALWMLLSLQRGALQGLHAYRPLGVSLIVEAGLRIVFGLILVAVGGGVTGAYLGAAAAFAVVAAALALSLRRRLHEGERAERIRPLRSLIGTEWRPVLGLFFLGILQNIDVIMAKHQLGGDRAGSYASAAVAAKTVLWVAIGIGLHLLPEATRRAAAGLDPQPVLVRAMAVLACVAVPALLVFAAVPHLLLSVAFGDKLAQADGALLILGIAMTLLAVSFLTVQYMLALGGAKFLWVLGLVAVAEPLLLTLGNPSLTSFATTVLALQAAAAAGVLALGWRTRVGVRTARAA